MPLPEPDDEQEDDTQRPLPGAGALCVVFRGKYLAALQQAFEARQLDFAGETIALAEPSAFRAFLAKLRAKNWVV